MAIIISSNLEVQGGVPIDSKFGVYTSVTQANTSISTSNRYVGLTVGIVTGSTTYNGTQL